MCECIRDLIQFRYFCDFCHVFGGMMYNLFIYAKSTIDLKGAMTGEMSHSG